MTRTERERLDQLFRDMYGKLLQYAYANLNDAEQAEDAVQDCFILAARKAGEALDGPNPRGWLVNTLKNLLRDRRRALALRRQRMLSALEGELDELPAAHDPQELAWLDLMYSGLIPDADYELLKMIYLQHRSLGEAAQALGIGEEACKKRLQRARTKMRAALEECL